MILSTLHTLHGSDTKNTASQPIPIPQKLSIDLRNPDTYCSYSAGSSPKMSPRNSISSTYSNTSLTTSSSPVLTPAQTPGIPKAVTSAELAALCKQLKNT